MPGASYFTLRQSLLNWPRQLPIEGEPADVAALVNAYGAFMASSNPDWQQFNWDLIHKAPSLFQATRERP